MGGRDWTVKDVSVTIRMSDELKLVLEVISVSQCLTVSDFVRHVLDDEPLVVQVRDKLRAMVNSTGGDDRP